MKIDIQKFNLSELFNDSTGKTSPTLTAGFLACMVGLGGVFVSGNTVMIIALFKNEKNQEIIIFMSALLIQCMSLFGLGATLLGIHRLSKDKPINENV